MRQSTGCAAVAILLSSCQFAAAQADAGGESGMTWPGGPASAGVLGVVIGVFVGAFLRRKRGGPPA